MNIDTLVSTYPTIVSNFVDDIEGIDTLMTITQNDIFLKKTDYNYTINISEALVEIIGKTSMIDVIESLKSCSVFDSFTSLGLNTYRIKTSLGEDQIAKIILDRMESIISQ